MSLDKALSTLLREPNLRIPLSILRGLRNGILYGIKIRLPHALVMTLLFKRGPWRQMAQRIFKATKQHARNLGKFVFIYKALHMFLNKTRGKVAQKHSWLAALVGGWIVFGENNAVNNQIVMYLFSRVVVGLARSYVAQTQMEVPTWTFSVFAAVVWATVLWQFEYQKSTLQPSLAHTMEFLYHDSDRWSTWRDFMITPSQIFG